MGSVRDETFDGSGVGGVEDCATAVELGGADATAELGADGLGAEVGDGDVVPGGLLEITAGAMAFDDVSLPASAVAATAIPATQSAAAEPTAIPRRRLRRSIRP